MATVYIQKEKVDHIVLTNDTGVALVQYQFLVMGGLSLISDEAVAIAAEGSFHVENGICFQVIAADMITGELTFATENQPVYWDPTTGKFSDTETAGYYKVGVLKEIKDSDGVILVSKNREAALVSSAVQTIVMKITADASTALPIVGLSEGDEIVNAHVICTASNASGTLIVETGAGDDITDGMICAVDTTVVNAGTIDDANSTLPATGAAIISVGGTAADTRGIVVIDYIPA